MLSREIYVQAIKLFDNQNASPSSYGSNVQWVQWIHRGFAAAVTNEEKKTNIYGIVDSSGKFHCGKCLNLHECCFVQSNSSKPPLHNNCHCFLVFVECPYITVYISDSKMSEYAFDPNNKNGKMKLFEKYGYDIADKDYLISEFTKQAQAAYKSGNYVLYKQNEYGQQINVTTNLLDKNTGKYIAIVVGWMVFPNGKIQLTTPFGGYAKQ